MSGRDPWRWFPAALAAAVALVWANTLRAPFTYDDKIEVIGNPTIRLLTEWGTIATYNLSRPLLIATYAVNWAVGAFDPLGYHVVSITIHALNAALAFRLLRRVLPVDRAALATALWALHPMTTEAVTYITGRSDALCATFWLIALEAWLCRGERGARATAIAAVVAGLLTKEVAVTLPLALFVLAAAVERERRVREYVGFGVAIAVAGAVRLGVYGWPRPEVDRPMLTQLCAQAEAWAVYLRLWLLPVGQSILHDHVAAVRWQGAAALVGGVIVGRLAWDRGGRVAAAVAIGALWLLPASLVPLKEVLAEHHAYGLGLALAALVAGAVPRARWGWPVVGILALATVARNELWRSEVTLWAAAAAENPTSADAAYGAADALRLSGDAVRAEAGFRRVLELRPEDENALVNLGIALAEQGRTAEAATTWEELLRADPRSCAAHNNLAALDLRAGRVHEAAEGYSSTLRWCPDDPIALYNLGNAYRLAGDPWTARQWFQRYLDKVPAGAQRDAAAQALRELDP